VCTSSSSTSHICIITAGVALCQYIYLVPLALKMGNPGLPQHAVSRRNRFVSRMWREMCSQLSAYINIEQSSAYRFLKQVGKSFPHSVGVVCTTLEPHTSCILYFPYCIIYSVMFRFMDVVVMCFICIYILCMILLCIYMCVLDFV